MCDNWKNDYSKEHHSCDGIVLDSGEGEYIVKGHINTKTPNATIMFWAANPPTYTTSYTGSGLPYPSADIAYENTPNRGAVKSNGGHFEFRVRYPNAYYMGLGSVYVEPCVHIKICEEGGDNKIHRIALGNGIPFRMLTYPPSLENTAARKSPMFYSGRSELPMRTQEQLLRESGYPESNVMPQNFWGKAVPHE
uniref:Uncharacterized protein n=1 Tax=viral metagenome TaxID=1070528 RepID=A0A6C0JEV2_9ZZZZ